MPDKYVRFAVVSRKRRNAKYDGLFVAAYELARGNSISPATREELNELLAWFQENLNIPKRFNKGGGKGYYRRETRGLSWFKPEANEHLTKAQRLGVLLGRAGVPVLQYQASRVGYIVYEDDHLVAAEPFADLT